MGEQTSGKLNWLQVHVPEGLLVDAGWLQRHGYHSNLRSKYVAHGWLNQVSRGVYRRPASKLTPTHDLGWQQVVVSLQTVMERPYTVGGRTALELQGFAHYLSNGPREIHLYGPKTAPGWLTKLQLDRPLVFHNADKLFTQQQHTNANGSFKGSEVAQASVVQQPLGQWGWSVTMSSPERAILELLDEVPQRETFHQADVLMEGLRTLRPRQLRALLLECRNVKVKRLFLWFAERHSHAWLKALDRTGVDLGRGKRMLVRGGKLDPKYNITVPEKLDAGG
jgi:hypothetical protein